MTNKKKPLMRCSLSKAVKDGLVERETGAVVRLERRVQGEGLLQVKVRRGLPRSDYWVRRFRQMIKGSIYLRLKGGRSR